MFSQNSGRSGDSQHVLSEENSLLSLTLHITFMGLVLLVHHCRNARQSDECMMKTKIQIFLPSGTSRMSCTLSTMSLRRVGDVPDVSVTFEEGLVVNTDSSTIFTKLL